MHIRKACAPHERAQFVDAARTTAAHGAQVKAEIGVRHARRSARPAHGLGNDHRAARPKRAGGGIEKVPDHRIVVIVQDTDEGNDVRARGQRVAPEVEAAGLDARDTARSNELRRGIRDGRQVEHADIDSRPASLHGEAEDAEAATDIEKASAALERHRREHLVRNHLLRNGHETRIPLRLFALHALCGILHPVPPERCQFPRRSRCAQHGDRIAQVAVEERVVFDHGAHPGVLDQCRPAQSEPVGAIAALAQEPERTGRAHQQLGALRRKPRVPRDFTERPRALVDERNEPEPHQRKQGLRVDEPCA